MSEVQLNTIETLDRQPFKHLVATIGNLPTSFVDSMSYYECIAWLVKYLETKVIPAINNNAEATEELQAYYIQLKEYVENYFENLDVQEEINNKLDDMAEQGQLTDIIAQYLQLAGVLAFNTVADMQAGENLVDGSTARTLGKDNYLDGEGRFYKIRNITNDDVVDGVNIIQITADPTNTLIAELIPDQMIELKPLIEDASRNSKWMSYLYVAEEARQSLDYVREMLNLCINAGFKECQMLINIESDGTLAEDATKFDDYNNIADELGIPITSFKVHGHYNYDNYQSLILSSLAHFPHVKTVFVMNEDADNVYEHGLNFPSVIKIAYPNVEKVGFTMSYGQAFRSNTITPTQWNSINEVFDVIGVHMYPSCTSYNNANQCTYDRVINAFNALGLDPNITKEIWITESGVLPYWQMLELPENYIFSKLSDTTFTIEPQRMFYRALSECDTAQKAAKIIPWYLESGKADNQHRLFDLLKNIIKNQ